MLAHHQDVPGCTLPDHVRLLPAKQHFNTFVLLHAPFPDIHQLLVGEVFFFFMHIAATEDGSTSGGTAAKRASARLSAQHHLDIYSSFESSESGGRGSVAVDGVRRSSLANGYAYASQNATVLAGTDVAPVAMSSHEHLRQQRLQTVSTDRPSTRDAARAALARVRASRANAAAAAAAATASPLALVLLPLAVSSVDMTVLSTPELQRPPWRAPSWRGRCDDTHAVHACVLYESSR